MFRTHVELPEPMRGLEVPQEIVEALDGGKRPRVTITINGHSWRSRVAIMRGRFLLGLADGKKLQHLRAIGSAKKPETRKRRIEQAVATLREKEEGNAWNTLVVGHPGR